MHETYTTEGFVLKTRPHKEDSVEALIFSETLGKVRVIAQAAKRAGATFAACTEPGTFGVYALIKGRFYWRLKGMDKLAQYTFSLPKEKKQTYLKILALLARLLPEHEVQIEIFKELKDFLEYDGEVDLERVEAEMAFKLLVSLGYADRSSDITDTKDLILEVNKGILAAGL